MKQKTAMSMEDGAAIHVPLWRNVWHCNCSLCNVKVACLRPFEQQPAEIQHLTGFETQFTPEDMTASTLQTPPKCTMVVIIWIAVYLTVLPLIVVLKPIFSPLPVLLGSAIFTVASVALITWAVILLLTAVFHFWLYPRKA